MKTKILILLSLTLCAFNTVMCTASVLLEEEASFEVSSNAIVLDAPETGNVQQFELPKPEPYRNSDPVVGGVLPHYYNAMEQGLVTPYKDQKDTKLCWTFATCAAIETNLAKKGYGLTSLSPYYLAKSALTPTDYNDSAMKAGYVTTNDYYNEEGNFLKATTTLRRGHGLKTIDESSLLITNCGSIDSDSDLGYTINKYEIFQGCKNFDSYDDFATTLDLIKERLIEYGSAYVSFSMNYNGLPMSSDGQYCLSYANHEQPATHAVQIIGYDDSFSRDTFMSRKPAHDGVFICKQSYGLDTAFAPIVYIPYEDMSIEEINFIDMSPVIKTTAKSDYLGAVKDIVKIYAYNKPCAFFSVFKNNTENIIELTDVSADFYMYDYTGTVQIYKNPEFREDSTFTKTTGKPCYKVASGTPLLKDPIPFYNYSCGMLNVPLQTSIKIKPGESYQVVFTIRDKDFPKIVNSETCVTHEKYTGVFDDFLNDKLYADIYVDGSYVSDEKVSRYNNLCLTKGTTSYPIFNNIGIQAHYTIGEPVNNQPSFKCNYNGHEYTILVDLDGGSLTFPDEVKIGYKFPKATKAGYKFKRWVLEGKKASKLTKKTLRKVTSDTLTLKAYYTPKKYKVCYLNVPPDAETPASGSTKSQTVTYGKEFRLKGRLKARGYALVGWCAGNNEYPLETPVKNLTTEKRINLTPVWRRITTVE